MSEDIETLSWREAVRKRPAMYIGSTGIQGFYYIFKEFFASFYTFIDTSQLNPNIPKLILEGKIFSLEITDKQSGIFRLEEPSFRVPANISESLHNFGFYFSVLNALSQNYEFRLIDNKQNTVLEQIYEKGVLKSGIVDKKEYDCKSLEVNFTLDSTIWGDFEINPYFVYEKIQELAFLNRDKIFELKYSSKGEDCRAVFHFPNGLKNLVELNSMQGLGSSVCETELGYISDDFSAEICFRFWDYSINESFFKSFVNNHYTHEGGTHANALLFGIARALKQYVKNHKPDDFFVITNRTILSSLIGAIHLKMKKPKFYGSTTNRLSSKEIIKPISDLVFKVLSEKFEADEETATKVIRHFYKIHWNRKWLSRL